MSQVCTSSDSSLASAYSQSSSAPIVSASLYMLAYLIANNVQGILLASSVSFCESPPLQRSNLGLSTISRLMVQKSTISDVSLRPFGLRLRPTSAASTSGSSFILSGLRLQSTTTGSTSVCQYGLHLEPTTTASTGGGSFRPFGVCLWVASSLTNNASTPVSSFPPACFCPVLACNLSFYATKIYSYRAYERWLVQLFWPSSSTCSSSHHLCSPSAYASSITSCY